MTLHFSIDGDYITKMAREKLFVEHDLASAIRILRGSLESDEISPDEQLMLCLQILHGAASIKGRSDTPEYGVEFRDDIDERPTDLSAIAKFITDMYEKQNMLQNKLDDLSNRFGYIVEKLPDYKLDQLNAEYYNEMDTPLFPDIPIPDWRKGENGLCGMNYSLLSDYMEQQKREMAKDENEPTDYGWLAPDGTFYPVDWGLHAAWADNWLNENRPKKQYPDLYVYNGQHISGGDVLVHSLGWVLLDSPHRGTPRATYDEKLAPTKAQQDFLYGYYTDRGMKKEANALFDISE